MDFELDTRQLEAELGIDPGALRARYREERDKRLRPDGTAQWVDTRGKFEHFGEDPWVDPDFSREPLHDKVDVLVIGGGLGALQLGTQLRKQGVQSLRFVERGGDFGGVWYWNRYPGAACDTQAILYLPMLEEMNYLPKQKFAPQAEILQYFQRIAQEFDLYRDTCFQTAVTGVEWDEAGAHYLVKTDRNDVMRARYVVIAVGPMDRPKLPGIPGIDRFRGHTFHTSRWDFNYTGGDNAGGMDRLRDKVIGIIGTGATAIQCIPHLAESCRHLYVFQRTPSSVDVKNDGPLDPEWVANRRHGWQQEILENFTTLVSGRLTDEDLIGDGWTGVMRNIKYLSRRMEEMGESVPHPLMLHQLADFMKMNEIRNRVDQVVEDPATAEALKPWYDRFCKRPCLSDDYLPTFNRPNVTLVSTRGQSVDEITENGVIVAGEHYRLDCLIFSTGFDVNTPFARRIGYPVVGRHGQTLAGKWAEGALTQHGIGTNGFPNLFIMSVTQTGVSLNFSHMIAEQAKHVAHILGRAIREDLTEVEVTREGELAWLGKLERTAVDQEAFQRECTPSYFNAEGDLSKLNRRNSQYGGGPITFYRILANWRNRVTMPGLLLKRGAEVVSDGAMKGPGKLALPADTDLTRRTRSAIEYFVEVYNEPDSDVFSLYAEKVDWLELPSGRSGGREELFEALKQARGFLSNLHLDVLSITAEDDSGVLESAMTANLPDGKALSARIIWFFTFRDGLIVREHDYSILPQ